VLRISTFDCSDPSDEQSPPQDQQRLADERFARQVTSALEAAPDFDRWILDLRDNPGGNPNSGLFLMDAVMTQSRVYTSSGYVGAPDPMLQPKTIMVSSDDFGHGADFRQKPLWVLANGGCFSQCYAALSALVESGRAELVGQEPDGGEGGPMPWVAPSGGWTALIPIYFVRDGNGRMMEGTTIHPNLPVLPDAADLTRYPDAQLAIAVQAIASH
jgi:C-terminal processing protease CtpA/Prc